MKDYYLTILALCWFLFCWIGYSIYSARQITRKVCLASTLRENCENWMRRMLLRENRTPDSNIISSLVNSVSFFASSSLFIIAGTLTVLGTMDQAVRILIDMPFVASPVRGVAELKLLFLSLIFIYAFFSFSWCIREYNFAAILFSSAPVLGEKFVSEQDKRVFIKRSSKAFIMANEQFNKGLRAYYFGMATLAWFINDYLYIFATICVIFVLYMREFHSPFLLEALVYKEEFDENLEQNKLEG